MHRDGRAGERCALIIDPQAERRSSAQRVRIVEGHDFKRLTDRFRRGSHRVANTDERFGAPRIGFAAGRAVAFFKPAMVDRGRKAFFSKVRVELFRGELAKRIVGFKRDNVNAFALKRQDSAGCGCIARVD